jgi:hypothetical protein
VLILDLAYLLVFILLSPLWLLLLILKPAMRAGLRERFVIRDLRLHVRQEIVSGSSCHLLSSGPGICHSAIFSRAGSDPDRRRGI